MEIRLLKTFLAIADEGSITRAADVLHVTQPALSRQLSLLETEVGAKLFRREKREMVLTDEGMLLRRRAREIVQLVDITESELKDAEANIEGTISIGMGELSACQTVLDVVDSFAKANPRVTFNMLTGVADQVTERIDQGLLDFGILLEPVEKERYSYVRLHAKEKWVATMRADDELAGLAKITPKDLIGRTLILPSRLNVRGELASWFGKDFRKADVRYTVNLGGMRAAMVDRDMGVILSVAGSVDYWDPARYKSTPLEPAIGGTSVLAWKRGVAHTSAVSAFLRHVEDHL